LIIKTLSGRSDKNIDNFSLNFERGPSKDHSTKVAIGPVVSEEKIKM
jgi:hypothetical protein